MVHGVLVPDNLDRVHGLSVPSVECNKEGYNGWSNWETWVVFLWLSNDEGSYNYAKGLTEEQLKEFVSGMVLTDGASMREDFLVGCLKEVDWAGVAKGLSG